MRVRANEGNNFRAYGVRPTHAHIAAQTAGLHNSPAPPTMPSSSWRDINARVTSNELIKVFSYGTLKGTRIFFFSCVRVGDDAFARDAGRRLTRENVLEPVLLLVDRLLPTVSGVLVELLKLL